MVVDGRSCVDIGARLDQGTCGTQVSIFGGNVKQGNADQRREGRNQCGSVFQQRRRCLNGSLDRVRVVQQNRRDRRVVKHGPALKQEAEAIRESVGARILLQQPIDR
jgi:hypothetical protein